MVKKLIKFILILLLFVIVLVGGTVAIIYVKLSNDTDDTPKTLYTAEADKSTIISTMLTTGFDLSNKQYIDITLNENETNLLLFCLIREKINNQYLPIGDDYTKPQNYIWSLSVPSDVPVVGGKGLVVKSVYTKIEDEKLKLYMPALIGKKKSCIELELSFSETNDAFYIKIEKLLVGKLNFTGKLMKLALKYAGKAGITDEMVEQKLSTDELKFDVSLQNMQIGLDKESLANFINKILSENMGSSEETGSMLTSLCEMLTSKENDILDLGVFGNRFGVRCDLAKADVDAKQLVLDETYKTFNEDLFVTSITQNYVISNIGSDDPKITITEKDFNALLYSKSNGYEGFSAEFDIPNITAKVKIEIMGIIVDLGPKEMKISVLVNLNGLKTVIELTGAVSGNNTDTLTIKLANTLTIGKGESDATKSAIVASSDFINAILAEKIDSMDLIKYDSKTNSMLITASCFEEMLAVDGGSTLPINVKSLSMSENGIEVHTEITDTGVAETLATVTTAISDFLEANTMTAEDFNITDPEQAKAVEEVLSSLDSVSEALTSGTISEDDTAALLENINTLSKENQEALFASVEDSISGDDLTNLYDQLFGK